MRRPAMLSWAAVLVVLAFAAACGSSSPSSPSSSGAGSVGIQGVVLSGASASAAPAELTASSGVKAGTGTITVTVQVNGVNTGITTTVSANGTFELKNVPSGSLTLVFSKDGVTIGTVPITVTDGAEVKITVQVQSTGGQTTTLIVVQIQIDEKEADTTTSTPATCAISGGKAGSGIELEGNVASGTAAAFKMTVNGERSSASVDVAAGSASYKCNGSPKATDAECKATLKPGVKVHVRGTLMTCTTSAASVTATEVMIQKGEGESE